MGLGSALFGSKPKVTLRTQSTLTPEQNTALSKNLGYFNNLDPSSYLGIENYGGDVAAGANPLQGMSLAALEQVAMNMSDPNGNYQLGQDQLGSFLRGEKTGTSNYDEFFKTNIQDPAMESFNKDILPGIGRSYGGSNFFSSERGRADDQARKDLVQGLTKERAAGQNQERQFNIETMLKAIGLAPQFDATSADISTRLLQGSLAARGADQTELDKLYQAFLDKQTMKNQQYEKLSSLLNRQAVENIVLNRQGSQGLLGSALAGFGAGVGEGLGKKLGG